jgi:hypothetical protein
MPLDPIGRGCGDEKPLTQHESIDNAVADADIHANRIVFISPHVSAYSFLSIRGAPMFCPRRSSLVVLDEAGVFRHFDFYPFFPKRGRNCPEKGLAQQIKNQLSVQSTIDI